ncbi:hypothetical protein [Roseomonas xinghualingensis]|uniref:hypothetical protein n=1 Tax=Roseomonas xinghualingensis TaxID=2986475 RepID=UPI0021F0C2A8|nr:hypothetical protein [Roseomonas sp. SXEYE001]MCV4210088.1 hypothetical protein [Roseomonas sp. SXEYE001]
MSHPADVACTRCRFFDDHVTPQVKVQAADKTPDEGLCRFNPPVSQPSPDAHGLWPIVSREDWCGHFTVDSPVAGSAD